MQKGTGLIKMQSAVARFQTSPLNCVRKGTRNTKIQSARPLGFPAAPKTPTTRVSEMRKTPSKSQVWNNAGKKQVGGAVPQECLTRVSLKSVLQECPATVSHKSVPQECPKRVSHKSVPQECSARVSHKSVPNELATGVSHKSVP